MDAAIMLFAMSDEDPNDPRTQGLPPVPDLIAAATPVAGGVAGRLRWPTRIGVIPGHTSGTSATAAARRAFLDAMSTIEGATVVNVTLPDEWDQIQPATPGRQVGLFGARTDGVRWRVHRWPRGVNQPRPEIRSARVLGEI